jgi:hypothetical protein
VRARVKAIEDLPEWTQCCEVSFAMEKAIAGRIVELQGKSWSGMATCLCGSRRMFTVYSVTGLPSHNVIDVSMVDIQEGA